MSEWNYPMDELYRENGYDPAELEHPKDVNADDIREDSVVVAYTVVRNVGDGPATTFDIDEWPIQDVVPADEVKEFTDGAVSYPEWSPVTHGVVWAYRTPGDVPKFAAIGYGDEMYGPDSDFDDPQRWERTVANVHSLSDDFIRFDL